MTKWASETRPVASDPGLILRKWLESDKPSGPNRLFYTILCILEDSISEVYHLDRDAQYPPGPADRVALGPGTVQ